MSDALIRLQDKRISELESELQEVKSRKDNLIKATKSDDLAPMRFEIERTIDGWDLTYPLNPDEKQPTILKGLESLKACICIIKIAYKTAQFRNQPFELYDHNSKTLFRDYRVFTEYLELSEKEKKIVKKKKRDPKSIRENTVKKLKSSRISKNGKVQSKVKKVDMRIYEIF